MTRPLDNTFGSSTVSPEERRTRIRGLFDRVAPRYDLMNDAMSFGIHRLWKRRFAKSIEATGTIVDLAGGTGDVARLLARAGGRTVIVCDPSLQMMKHGRETGPPGICWVAGEAERLPFPDGSVAALTISFGIRNVTHLAAALAEARRVLQPGGQFACLEFSTPRRWIRPFYDLYSFSVIPRLGSWISRQPDAYRYLVESIRNFPDQETFAGMLRDAGFDSVEYDNLSFGIACIHRATTSATPA